MPNQVIKHDLPIESLSRLQHNEVLGQFGLINNRLDEQAVVQNKVANALGEQADKDHNSICEEVEGARKAILKAIDDLGAGSEIVAEARAEKTFVMLEELAKDQQRNREHFKALIGSCLDKTQVAINSAKDCTALGEHIEDRVAVLNSNLVKVSADLSATQLLVQKLVWIWLAAGTIIGGSYLWIKLQSALN